MYALLCLAIGFSYFFDLGNAACYYPDGSIATRYKPCNITSYGEHSACCDTPDYSQCNASEGYCLDDACSTRGYCMGGASVMYRGGCTDANWESDNCARECRTSSLGTFSNIYPCSDPQGAYTFEYCCDEGAGARGASCCNTSVFSFPDSGGAGNFYSPERRLIPSPKPSSATLATSSSRTIDIQDTSTDPASTTSAHSTSPQDTQMIATASHLVYTTSPDPTSGPAPSMDSVKIMIGVAVPVAVLSILTLGALVIRQCKRARTPKDSEKTATRVPGAEKGVKAPSNPSAALGPQELENPFGGFRELGSRQIYEASGQSQ